jgi:hypothetical protein
MRHGLTGWFHERAVASDCELAVAWKNDNSVNERIMANFRISDFLL